MKTTCALACLGLLVCDPASSEIIADFSPVLSSSETTCYGVTFSDLNQGFQSAIGFTACGNAIADTIVWYGGYINSSADPAGPIAFRIRFFAGVDVPSGVDPYAEYFVMASGVLTDAFANPQGCTGLLPVYQYTAAIPPTGINQDEPVWLSIVEDTEDRVWFQPPGTGTTGGRGWASRFEDGTGWTHRTGRMMAVTILGQNFCPTTTPGLTWGRLKILYR